jgi:poly-gamma-glutamate synthesis protein (capsule biosynthesis protein)
VDPKAGCAYLDRTQLRPGMIVRPGPVLEAFEAAGWRWGGDAETPDYHHLSKP